MDREKKDELPKMQVGFIDAICLPIYKVCPSFYTYRRYKAKYVEQLCIILEINLFLFRSFSEIAKCV